MFCGEAGTSWKKRNKTELSIPGFGTHMARHLKHDIRNPQDKLAQLHHYSYELFQYVL